MKVYALALYTSLVICTASAQQPPASLPQSKPLEEASRLSAEAVALYAKGEYAEAASPAKRALEIREKILAPDDKLVVSAVLNLAEIQLARDQTLEAKVLFERALRSYERMFGVEDPRLIAVLDRLAVIQYRMGRADQTEKLFARALAIGEKSFGLENPNIGPSLFNLAEFYQFQAEFKKAEPLYQRLIAIREKNNAGKEAMAEARERYACLLYKTKRLKEAGELEDLVLGTNRETGTPKAIEGGVVNGRAINLVTPPYPQDARAARITGAVTVRVTIDERGRVIRACAVEGPTLFTQVAESAARRSRFTPTLLSGTAVKVNGVIVYNFTQ